MGRFVADVPSGLSLTPPKETKNLNSLTLKTLHFPTERIYTFVIILTAIILLNINNRFVYVRETC
jgi:hypothetical protein